MISYITPTIIATCYGVACAVVTLPLTTQPAIEQNPIHVIDLEEEDERPVDQSQPIISESQLATCCAESPDHQTTRPVPDHQKDLDNEGDQRCKRRRLPSTLQHGGIPDDQPSEDGHWMKNVIELMRLHHIYGSSLCCQPNFVTSSRCKKLALPSCSQSAPILLPRCSTLLPGCCVQQVGWCKC